MSKATKYPKIGKFQSLKTQPPGAAKQFKAAPLSTYLKMMRVGKGPAQTQGMPATPPPFPVQ